MEIKNRTISLVVKNKPDVLARVAGIFSGRGFNIENISANTTMDPSVTKITIVTRGDTAKVVKIEKQLKKLVDIISVIHVEEEDDNVRRELVLARVWFTEETRDNVMKAVEKYGLRILSKNGTTCTVEATGESDKIELVLESLASLSMIDMSRSGVVAL